MPSKTPHELLLLGHVTLDLFGSERRLGGAVSFAAQAASLFDIPTRLFTSASRDFAELNTLRRQPELQIEQLAADAPTTFRLVYAGATRTLERLARATDLEAGALPPAWRTSALTLALPVAGECDEPLLTSLRSSWLGLGLQGWLRAVTDAGHVVPILSPKLDWIGRVAPRLVVFSEADHPEAEAIAASLASPHRVVALTRGAQGSTLWHGGSRADIQAFPAREVDATGAGDVFTLLLALALYRGVAPARAAAYASYGAARAVEGPGLGTLPASLAPLEALAST